MSLLKDVSCLLLPFKEMSDLMLFDFTIKFAVITDSKVVKMDKMNGVF